MRKLEMIEISEILYRWNKGMRVKGIAKSLGYARNSVKSIIKQAEADNKSAEIIKNAEEQRNKINEK